MRPRDLTITSKSMIPGAGNTYVRIKATNFSGDDLQVDLLRSEAEALHVFDRITITIEKAER